MRTPKEDTLEQIHACLNCPRAECNNCHYHSPGSMGKGAARKARTVIAFREGEEDMIFDSAVDAADFFHVTPGAIRSAAWGGKECQGYSWRYEKK